MGISMRKRGLSVIDSPLNLVEWKTATQPNPALSLLHQDNTEEKRDESVIIKFVLVLTQSRNKSVSLYIERRERERESLDRESRVLG